MFTNRLFNLIVAALVVILAIQFVSVAGSPVAATVDNAAGKYEDRYDRMNNPLVGKDPSSIVGKYENRYDRMNESARTDSSYIVGKHEDRYDFMNDFPGADR